MPEQDHPNPEAPLEGPQTDRHPEKGGQGTKWSVALAIAIIGMICSLAQHIPFVSDDYVSMESLLSLGYQEPFSRNWSNHGFFALKGKPIFQFDAQGGSEKDVYSNHPPLSYWLIFLGVKIFGPSTAGFRSMPILMTALTAFLLALYATRKSGAWAGLAAGLIYATLPMTFFFGRNANFETFIAFFGTAAVILTIEAKGKWGLALSSLLWFTTGFTDWVALFLALSFLVVHLSALKKLRFTPRHAIMAVLVSFSVYAVLLSFWVGSPFTAIALLSDAANGGIKEDDWHNWGKYFANQKTFWNRYYAISGITLASLGVLVGIYQICRRRCSEMMILSMTWALTAVVNVAVFLNRSKDHEFWWFYASPAIALFGAMFFSRVFRINRMVGVILLAALLLLNMNRTFQTYEVISSFSKEIENSLSDSRFDEDTLILDVFKGKIVPRNFSPKADYITIRNDLPLVHGVIHDFLTGKLDKKRLVVWYAADIDERLQLQLQVFIFNGAKHETDGKTSLLIFERN